jgi:hypothetical protein
MHPPPRCAANGCAMAQGARGGTPPLMTIYVAARDRLHMRRRPHLSGVQDVGVRGALDDLLACGVGGMVRHGAVSGAGSHSMRKLLLPLLHRPLHHRPPIVPLQSTPLPPAPVRRHAEHIGDVHRLRLDRRAHPACARHRPYHLPVATHVKRPMLRFRVPPLSPSGVFRVTLNAIAFTGRADALVARMAERVETERLTCMMMCWVLFRPE